MAGKSVEPDWAAFLYEGAEWFVGYGMDTADRWRNLPQVYRILKEQAA
jgi:hypoxanthine-guanine phosphoribosyltransferase